MVVKVGIVSERWLSKWVLRLLCGYQSWCCVREVVVKMGFEVVMWLSMWVLCLRGGCQNGF